MIYREDPKYSKWEQALLGEAGINWSDDADQLVACGNPPGINPDVGYLLFRFANDPSVQSVLEMGSGFSTYVLAKTCLKLNTKEIIAIESLEEWSKPPLCFLPKQGIAPSFYYVTGDRIPPVFSEGKQWDMAWVDGAVSDNATLVLDRGPACLYYKDHLKHAVLLFDDAQGGEAERLAGTDVHPGMADAIRGMGRSMDDTVWFNPTGRADRHVLISFPEPNHPLLPLVKECTLT